MPSQDIPRRLTAFGIVAEIKKLLGVKTDDEILPAVSALVGGKSKSKSKGESEA